MVLILTMRNVVPNAKLCRNSAQGSLIARLMLVLGLPSYTLIGLIALCFSHPLAAQIPSNRVIQGQTANRGGVATSVALRDVTSTGTGSAERGGDRRLYQYQYHYGE